MRSPLAIALLSRGYDDRTILRTLALWRVLYHLDEVTHGGNPRHVWISERVVNTLVERWGMCSDALTCDSCRVNACEWRGDGRNTNGDCLAEK